MKLLVISKKVFFKKELFGWFLIWQFVICKSYKKMLNVYAQATMLKNDLYMHYSVVKNWAPTQRWVGGQVCLIIGPSECRKWSQKKMKKLSTHAKVGLVWGVYTGHKKNQEWKIEHPREGGSVV